VISLRQGFLFVHIPKTAGNSIQNVLRRYSEDEIVAGGGRDGLERFEVRSAGRDLEKHSTLADYRRELGADFEGLFKFACVRNPWDRLVSHYFSPYRGEVKWSPRRFKRFVSEEVKPLGHYCTLGEDDGGSPFDNLDLVLRFESLAADFEVLCGRLAIAHEPLPVRNRSSRSGAAEYYDAKLRDWVGERFAEEIEYFGYEAP